VSERLRWVHRGVRGGATRPPFGGAGGFGSSAPDFFFFSGRHISARMTYFRDHMILGGFSAHGFLPMVFYLWLRN
jgi:hypothetical protein